MISNKAIELEQETIEKAKTSRIEEEKKSTSKARDKLTEILVSTFSFTQPSSAHYNTYLLILQTIVEVTSDEIVASGDESTKFEHRKWVEVIVDLMLNIRESKSALTEFEYIDQFNYSKNHSIETLKFLLRIYNSKRENSEWDFLEYFMSVCLGWFGEQQNYYICL